MKPNKQSYERYYTRDGISVSVFPTPELGSETYGYDAANRVLRCAYCGNFITDTRAVIHLWKDSEPKTISIFCSIRHSDGSVTSRCFDAWREALTQRSEQERDNNPTHLPFPLRPRPS